MRVHLSRDEMAWPSKFLNAAQIGAGVEHVRGVAMSEFVGAEVGIEACGSQILFRRSWRIRGEIGVRFFSASEKNRRFSSRHLRSKAQ